MSEERPVRIVLKKKPPGIPTIYVITYNASFRWGDTTYYAIAEDGSVLANHTSSTPDFAKMDMGCGVGSSKHDSYFRKYPDGFALEWVGLYYQGVIPELDRAIELNGKLPKGAVR